MNKVILLGRTTKDIELRYAQSGTGVAKFTLAVNRAYKKDGDQQADFISCIAFNKTAETLTKYVNKGRQIAVEGRIQTGSYDKDGTRVYTTDVIVERFYFADSKQGGQAQGNYQPQPQQTAPSTKQSESDDGFYLISDDDDDLPF